ncbi:MAG: hypothetical protein M0P69_18210 [Bacteroidales bacterium]|jgi:hypothetical protein|nr:hypothetical protein [Bacteroidales bacterium]
MRYFLTILLAAFASIVATAAETNLNNSAAQYLMADQHGKIIPQGYAAGLQEIAATEAQAAATATAAQLVTETTAAASNVVADVVSALTGAYGFAYVTGHTVSFSGAVQVSTNVSAQIIHMELGAGGNMTTNAIAHSGHYVWHVYSEAMNTMPAIKYKRELDGTNAWEFVAFQSTAEFTDTIVDGITYPVVYRSTVWLPSIYDQAFFMAFCEIKGGGQAGALLDIEGGLSVGGKVGFSGQITRNGKIYTYITGLLMGVEDDEVQP